MPTPDLVTFTGGVAVGKYIASKAGYRRMVLELGGNDPLVVMEDADGEGVRQVEHALQSAALAERDGAPAELVCAALLHNIGHMLNDKGETPTLRGIDDLHQYAAVSFLRPHFPEAVLGPMRLHVDVKRYLCATRAEYLRRAVGRLQAQPQAPGRRVLRGEAERFIRQPYAGDAVRVRLRDNAAKIPRAPTPDLSHFESALRAIAHS